MKPIKLLLTLSLALSLNAFSDTIGQEAFFKYRDDPIGIKLLNQNGDIIASTEFNGRILISLQVINSQENQIVRIEFQNDKHKYRFNRDLYSSANASHPVFRNEEFTFKNLIDYINENEGKATFYIHRKN